MSKPEHTLNPYASPDLGYAPTHDPRGGGRPGWYTFFCVIAIVMGSLGAFNALLGTPMLIFASSLQQGFQGPPGAGMPAELVELQEKMNAEVHAVTQRYFWFLLAAQLFLAVVAAGLLLGGVLGLRMTRGGAKLLSSMFLATSIFEVGRLVLTIFHQMETGEIMRKYFAPIMEKTASAQGGQGLPPGMNQFVSNAMSIGMGIGICFVVGWVLVKIGIYMSGWVYLQKAQVQALLKD